MDKQPEIIFFRFDCLSVIFSGLRRLGVGFACFYLKISWVSCGFWIGFRAVEIRGMGVNWTIGLESMDELAIGLEPSDELDDRNG